MIICIYYLIKLLHIFSNFVVLLIDKANNIFRFYMLYYYLCLYSVYCTVESSENFFDMVKKKLTSSLENKSYSTDRNSSAQMALQ